MTKSSSTLYTSPLDINECNLKDERKLQLTSFLINTMNCMNIEIISLCTFSIAAGNYILVYELCIVFRLYTHQILNSILVFRSSGSYIKHHIRSVPTVGPLSYNYWSKRDESRWWEWFVCSVCNRFIDCQFGNARPIHPSCCILILLCDVHCSP